MLVNSHPFNRPTVKICGIRDSMAAGVAARAGASALGVVLAPSHRQINPETAQEIRIALRGMNLHIPIVGVVVNETARSLNELIEHSGIDIVQLSGDETPDLLDDVPVPVIKAVRLFPGQTAEDARRTIDPWLSHSRPVEMILLDAYADGHYGGTGLRADWALAAQLAEHYPLMLAGGLTPANVGDSVRQVGPSGVDVSSGVETGGIKDHAKIEAFIAAFHSAPRRRIEDWSGDQSR